jgi:hypothetical protein
MTRKLIVALVLITATHSKCQLLSELQPVILKKVIEAGIIQSNKSTNKNAGRFSSEKHFKDLEFNIFKKENKNLKSLLRTFEILDSLSTKENSKSKVSNNEPPFLEYFSGQHICYETEEYIVVQSVKTSDVLIQKNKSPIIFKEVQILNVFRSMLNLILFFHESNICLIHLSKHSFVRNEADSNSQMSFKLFTISGILDNDDEIQKWLNDPKNVLRSKSKDASHRTRNLLFQNDLWKMTVFLHMLVTGDFQILDRISDLVQDYENLVIEYQNAIDCREQSLEKKSQFNAMVEQSNMTMNEMAYKSYSDYFVCSQEFQCMINPMSFLNISPFDYNLKKEEAEQKLLEYCTVMNSFQNSVSHNILISEKNEEDLKKNEDLLNKTRARLFEESELLVEEHKKIEEEVANTKWIIENKVNYSSANKDIDLVKLVTEMLKTGNETKKIREIIGMLDEIIKNANSEKMKVEVKFEEDGGINREESDSGEESGKSHNSHTEKIHKLPYKRILII